MAGPRAAGAAALASSGGYYQITAAVLSIAQDVVSGHCWRGWLRPGSLVSCARDGVSGISGVAEVWLWQSLAQSLPILLLEGRVHEG